MKRRWWLLFWLLAIGLVIWALRTVPLTAAITLIQSLAPAGLLAWLLMNVVVVITMTARWWYVLAGMGHRLPLLTLTRYRLAAFGVSYFTPGPQFGGEPFLVFPLRQNHNVATTQAIAAVSIEKALELLVNFSFLTAGVLIALLGHQANNSLTPLLLPLALGLLALPSGFLWLFWRGYQPFSNILRWLQRRWRHFNLAPAAGRVAAVENGIVDFCRHTPQALGLALLGSLLNWTLMLLEYWFLYWLLGAKLDVIMLATAYTAARLAFLLPAPGALGALESSQIAAAGLLGLDPVIGFSTALLIRMRDIGIGLLGLWLARSLARPAPVTPSK